MCNMYVTCGMSVSPQISLHPPTVALSVVASEQTLHTHLAHCCNNNLLPGSITYNMYIMYLCRRRLEWASKDSLEAGVASFDTNVGRHCTALWEKCA